MYIFGLSAAGANLYPLALSFISGLVKSYIDPN